MISILAFVTDLLFQSKINEVARNLHYAVQFETKPEKFLEAFQSHQPKLVLVDLTAKGVDFLSFFQIFYKNTASEGCAVVGYTTHGDWKQTEPLHQYCGQVLTKNVFVQNLPNLILGYLKRHEST